MEAACCPLLAPLLCFCFPSFKAFFVSAEDAWKERGWGMQTEQSSAMAARCPCHRRVGVELSTSGCALCSLPGAWCLHGHWLFSPEPSFHTEKPVASGKKKKIALWTAPLHRHSQLLLTQAPRNLLRSVHTLLNQPAAEEGPLRSLREQQDFLRGLKGWKLPNVCFANTHDWVKNAVLFSRVFRGDDQQCVFVFHDESSDNHLEVRDRPYFYSIPMAFSHICS